MKKATAKRTCDYCHKEKKYSEMEILGITNICSNCFNERQKQLVNACKDCKNIPNYICESCGQKYCSDCALQMEYECDCTCPPRIVPLKQKTKANKSKKKGDA